MQLSSLRYQMGSMETVQASSLDHPQGWLDVVGTLKNLDLGDLCRVREDGGWTFLGDE